jgi:hypothetical protein
LSLVARKAFGAAIDQLLSNTVWRDTKSSLILFIRKGDATTIIEKADGAIRAHDGFAYPHPAGEPDLWRDFLMRARDDKERTIRLALLSIAVRNLRGEVFSRF